MLHWHYEANVAKNKWKLVGFIKAGHLLDQILAYSLSLSYILSVYLSQSMEAQMQLYPGFMHLKSDNSGQSDIDGANMLHRRSTGIEVQCLEGVAETRIVRLIEPLKERRRILLASKEMHQVTQDLEDEIVSLCVLPSLLIHARFIFRFI